jgi:hypothetical protein
MPAQLPASLPRLGAFHTASLVCSKVPMNERSLLCTEDLARAYYSLFATLLPVYTAYRSLV